MSVINAASPGSRNCLICENVPGRLGGNRSAGITPEHRYSLEEEIYNLRAMMVNAAKEGNSFTSEIVIRISKLLDEKINEYNAYMKQNKDRE